MIRKRVIPVLLLQDGGLVKTVRFRDPKYVGDPVNAVRIFNEKEVDELILLDINATRLNRPPDLSLIREIAGECFMPLAYGGGITSFEHACSVFNAGVEKVILGAALAQNLDLVNKIASVYGSQAVVGVIDFKKSLLGKYTVTVNSGTKDIKIDPVRYATKLVEAGIGEIFLNSVDRDGTFSGYDIPLLKAVTSSVSVPVISCGGGHLDSFSRAFSEGGASAAAAGSAFVFHGKHRAVLINYPTQQEIVELSRDKKEVRNEFT